MTTTDHPTPLTALGDELYVELVSGYRVEPHTVSFPALVDEHRRQGIWVRPRFRHEAAEAIADWLNLVYPLDPDWYPLARLDGDTLLILRGDSEQHCHAVEPDDDGRYGLGPEGGCWFLSIPTRTTATELHDLERLCDRSLHVPADGEVLVCCDPDDLLVGAFPAEVEPRDEGSVVPTFRREIAEAVVAWCTSRHRVDPDSYPQAYLDADGTLVHVHQRLRGLDGYIPWRINPDSSGKYRIDGAEWAFRTVPADIAAFTPRLPKSRV